MENWNFERGLREVRLRLAEEMKKSHFISLFESLNVQTKKDLIVLIERGGYKGIKKSMKKADVIKALEEAILDKFQCVLRAMTNEEFLLIAGAISANGISVAEALVPFYISFENKGFIQFFYGHIDNEYELVFPKELADAFLSFIQGGDIKDISERTEIDKCVKALCHLYGAYSDEQLDVVWKRLYNKPLNLKLVDQVVELSEILSRNYFFIGGCFMEDFLYHQNLYFMVLEQGEGKEYYIPSREEVDYYSEHFFDEEDLRYKKLKKFLGKTFKLDDESCDELGRVLYLDSITGLARPTSFMDFLNDEGLIFQTEKKLSEFLALYMDFTNNTRKWMNRGHRPDEVVSSQKTKRPFTVVPGGISDEPKTKVGRNDLCPCGSGKQYKYCCGKFLK